LSHNNTPPALAQQGITGPREQISNTRIPILKLVQRLRKILL
jgi:hypothetical protein